MDGKTRLAECVTTKLRRDSVSAETFIRHMRRWGECESAANERRTYRSRRSSQRTSRPNCLTSRLGIKTSEKAYKPGLVSQWDNGHFSRTAIACRLQQPTRKWMANQTSSRDAETPLLPVWPCSRWGLPSQPSHLGCWCALTAPFHPYLEPEVRGGLLSVALSRASRPVGVTDHLVLWSPDFPPPMNWQRSHQWHERAAVRPSPRCSWNMA